MRVCVHVCVICYYSPFQIKYFVMQNKCCPCHYRSHCLILLKTNGSNQNSHSNSCEQVTLQYNTENNWQGRRTEIFEIEPKDHFLEMLDTFCMEITGTKKAPFDFEQDLLNQANVMSLVGSERH